MPVILNSTEERRWLNNDSNLSTVLGMLKPISDRFMNAYQIDPGLQIKKNDLSIVQPIGAPFYKDPDLKWNRKKSIVKRESNLPGWGESISKNN